MMGRDRRNGRANSRTRIGITAAAVVGAGAIAVAAVAATSHGPASGALSAGYQARISHSNYTSEWSKLNSTMNNWAGARQSSYTMLASMTQQTTFSQTTQHGKTLAEQRGIVVLATPKFLILQSANGSLHLWLLSGKTTFQDVSNSTAGTAAMTANTSATQQAMVSGNMLPATNLMAGSPLVASSLLTPATATQTVTVQVSGTDLTVTVTVTKSTATISQTATMPSNANPWWSPSTTTQNAWMTPTATTKLMRGDLAVVVGSRSHNMLHAQLVLFSPLTTAVVGGSTATGGTVPAATPTVKSTVGASGTHY